MSPHEHRIEELEVKVAYLEAHNAELSQVLREFADRVVDLEAQLGALRRVVESAELPDAKEPEKPPHY